MKFSVLIPVYNVEKYLPECLESLKNQTFQDFEVVLVDDGSTDHSGKICDDFKQEHKDTIVVHKKNEGLVAARRAGITNANGEYLIFCDSDDFIQEDALQQLAEVISATESDLVIYNAYEYCDGKRTTFFENVLPEGVVAKKDKLYDIFLLTYKINSLCMKAVKRELIDADRDYSELYDCGYGEDFLQSAPIIKNAKKIYYLNKKLYNYRVHASMMHKYNSRYYWSYRKVNREVYAQLKDVGIVDFEEKIAVDLLVAAYGATTQFKYAEKFDKTDLEKINDDAIFVESYDRVFKSKYVNELNSKQKLMLFLLKKKWYWIINILLKMRK